MKTSALLFFFLFPFLMYSQQSSVLSSGDWYKIAVSETGVYKITYDDLTIYGIDPGQIDPRNIALYGNPAGMLPEPLDDPYYTDLTEMAIRVVGEDDGSFDPEDYILFYGQSPVIWKYDPETKQFHHEMNLYTQQTFYFLTFRDYPGKRIPLQQSETLPQNAIIDTLDLLIYHEKELVNPGKTGKVWLGELFQEELNHDFNIDLTGYDLYPDGHQFNTVLAAKTFDTSWFSISVNNQPFPPFTVQRVNPESPYQLYNFASFDTVFSLNNNAYIVSYHFEPGDEQAKGWLDYFEMNLKIKPVFAGDQMCFRSVQNTGSGNISLYKLKTSHPENLEVWNVSDPLNVTNMGLIVESDSVWFKIRNDDLLEFCAFNGNTFYSPGFSGQVENQSLHSTLPPDLLIITHPDFLEQAGQLAAYHEENDGMIVRTYTTDQVYNEFSSGAQDVMAIRNFVRYLREQSGDTKPAYLLLFGDASYDYLDRVEDNTNFVPTFESHTSSNTIMSYATDDYFGMKSFDDGSSPVVAVGRIPVKTTEEANAVLDKIETYNNPDALGKWKNEMMFIADDGDNNLHLKMTETLTNEADTNSPVFDQIKCYFDFYQLIQTDEGPRYPEVNAIINKKTNEGVFYVNYTGHSGAEQLGAERVLSKGDLDGWNNMDNLPLWVLASGDVAHYDDPENTSIGEAIFLKKDGGAIALIGPDRAVFAHSNMIYNMAILSKFTNQSLQNDLRFGDLLIPQPQGSENDLKFTLLGDPALKIRFPEFNVTTTALNGIDIEDYSDTIPPGGFLTFQGEITSKDDGNLQADFNGTVYLKVYAPPYLRSTLGNNDDPIMEVEVQDSVLVEGTAAVENGEFEITVVLPANYYEGFGNLKLSWYAENGQTDANGYYSQLVYGGEPSAIAEENELLDRIKVYPTAFTDYLNVELPATGQSVTFRVFNTVGSEIYSEKSNSNGGVEQIHIPGLAKGMYILNVSTDRGSKNFKIFRY
ncbi:MAG: type IX secretion system sortase PorU [Chlorobi bacterium]|nr:type IX secretion system sortase PorU [Chlorobiota bacterium]